MTRTDAAYQQNALEWLSSLAVPCPFFFAPSHIPGRTFWALRARGLCMVYRAPFRGRQNTPYVFLTRKGQESMGLAGHALLIGAAVKRAQEVPA